MGCLWWSLVVWAQVIVPWQGRFSLAACVAEWTKCSGGVHVEQLGLAGDQPQRVGQYVTSNACSNWAQSQRTSPRHCLQLLQLDGTSNQWCNDEAMKVHVASSCCRDPCSAGVHPVLLVGWMRVCAAMHTLEYYTCPTDAPNLKCCNWASHILWDAWVYWLIVGCRPAVAFSQVWPSITSPVVLGCCCCNLERVLVCKGLPPEQPWVQ